MFFDCFDEINHMQVYLAMKKHLDHYHLYLYMLYSYISVIIENIFEELYDKLPIFLLQFNVSNYEIINHFMTK